MDAAFGRPQLNRQGEFTVFTRIISGALAALSLTFAACSGDVGVDSGGISPPSSSCTTSTCGTAYIGMMDADGDFESYTVDVVSLTLKKADGATVDTLPVKPRIDFASLVDLKEFLTAATIPPGTYVQGTLRLDYTNADIVVDVNGVPTHAVAVDVNGAPLTTVDLDVQLDNRKQLTIIAGKAALLELDFDLLASNSVDLTKSPVQVTVQPFIVASVDVPDSREARVRGPLVSVDTASGNYHIDLRPFNLASARLGDVTVHTTSQTEFEIDGTPYEGAAGIAALAALSAGSPTAAYGTLDTSSRTFTALRVHAGTSVAGSQFDAIEGTVVARTGSNLIVRGVTLIKRTGSVAFERGNTTVVLGQNTKVTKDGQKDTSLNLGAISVGQRIHAFGTVTEASNGDATLDATSGRVRMHLTRLLGTVKSTTIGGLTLDLTSIDGQRASLFTFAGTGVQPAQDADPTSYQVDTGGLNLSGFDVGSAARVFGFVEPFGTAPPDFEGRTLVSFRDVPAVLSVGFGIAGTSGPFLTIDANAGLVIDNHNSRIDARHFIVIGPKVIDVKTLASSPALVPDSSGGMFALGEPKKVEIYTTFADFIPKLNDKLLTEKVVNISATGSYDAAKNVLTAKRVLIELR
jgi:hypothetical protein